MQKIVKVLTLEKKNILIKRDKGDKSLIKISGIFRVKCNIRSNKEPIGRNHVIGDIAREIFKISNNIKE